MLGNKAHVQPGIVMPNDLDSALGDLLKKDPMIFDVLRIVQSLDLPDSWVTAGLIRSRVWDHLHHYRDPTPLNDIDVVYVDVNDLNEDVEKRLEAALRHRSPNHPWSVKNQARMALLNGDQPYHSASQALERWCETPTAVAARFNIRGALDIMAPLGLDDLFSLTVRPTPFALNHPQKLAQYRERMKKKNWSRQWPRLRVLGL